MPGEDRVESLVNKAGIEQEFAFVESGLGKIELRLGDIKSMILGLDTKIDLAKNMGLKDVDTVTRNLTKSQQDAEKATQALIKTQILQERQAQATANRLLAEERLRKANAKAIEQEAIAMQKRQTEAERKSSAFQGGLNDRLNAARQGATVIDTSKEDAAALNEKVAAEREYNLALEEEIRNKAELEAIAGRTPQKGSTIIKEETQAVSELAEEYELVLTPLEESIEARTKLQNTNKNLKKDMIEDKALLKAGTIDRIEYNKRIAEGSAAIEINKNKIQTLNREIRANAILENQSSSAIDKLRAKLTLLTIQYERMGGAANKSKAAMLVQKEAAAVAAAIDKTQASVGNYTKNVGNYFSRVFSGLRTIANILPGIGLAGLFGLIFTAIGNAVSGLNLFEGAAKRTGKQIDALTGYSQQSKDAIKKLGDTVEEIADKAFENMQKAIEDVNKELGNMPDAIEQSLIAVDLLKGKVVEYKDNLRLAETAQSNFNGTTGSGGLLELFYASKIEETTKEINKQIIAQQELNRVRGLAELQQLDEEKTKVRLQDIKDGQELTKLQQNNETNIYNLKQDLIKKNYEQQKILNTNVYYDELRLAGGNQAKIYAAEQKLRSANLLDYAKFVNEKEKLEREYQERLRTANREITDRVLQDQVDRNKKRRDDPNELPEIRINALQKVNEAQIKLFESAQKDELAKLKYYGDGRKKYSEAERAEINNIFKKYEDAKADLLLESQEKLLELQVLGHVRERNLVTENIEDLRKIRAAFLTPQDVEINNNSQEAFYEVIKKGAAEANVQLQKLAFTGDKLSQVLTHLFPIDAKDNVDDYVKSILALGNALKSIGKEGVEAAFDLLDNKYDNQANAIQDQIDLLDEKKAKDIEIANSSIANEEKRAAAIATINARTEAQKAILEKKQRDLAIRKAQFQKAQDITSILTGTAVAVVGALGQKPFTPANIATAAIVGALGLVQAVRAAAAPIPRYWKGTEGRPHPGGEAIVGDGGRHEGLFFPDGTIMKSPAVATVMNLPAGTHVEPDWEKMVSRDIMYVNENGKLVDTSRILKKGFSSMVKAIKNKQEIHLHSASRSNSMLQKGTPFRNYIDLHV